MEKFMSLSSWRKAATASAGASGASWCPASIPTSASVLFMVRSFLPAITGKLKVHIDVLRPFLHRAWWVGLLRWLESAYCYKTRSRRFFTVELFGRGSGAVDRRSKHFAYRPPAGRDQSRVGSRSGCDW